MVGGYRQQYGFDYFDTYSSVVRQTTFRLIVCIAAFHSLTLHHFDIDTAFLYGEVEEEIFIEIPEGLEHTLGQHSALRLRKSLYASTHDFSFEAPPVLSL